jgi:flagellar basal body-associated protein FliL
MNNKKHQENKVIILLITAVSAVLVAWLFVVVVLGSQLANNASAQTMTNQSDASMIEKQHDDDANNMSNYTGNKTKTPITEINSTEIGIATPTTDSIK